MCNCSNELVVVVNAESVLLSLPLSRSLTHSTLENEFCSIGTGLSSPQKSD